MSSVSMSSLASKYKDFLVPAMKLKVGGHDITGKSEYAVESVELTLSQEAASAASIRLTNVYDQKNRKFVGDVSSDFILGELVEVELGYGSSLTSLFYGYVDEINYELSDSPSVNVTAVDVRKIMMGSKKSNISHNVKSYSDAFQEVVKKYSAVYKGTDVDATDKMEVECIPQNGNDYDFIKKVLCRKGDRDFFVHAGKVYFKKTSADLFGTVEMEWGRDLLSFHRRATFQDVIIKILGQDLKKKEEVEAEVEIKSDDEQKKLVQSEKTEMNADIEDSDSAKKIADYKAEQEKKRGRQAGGSCIGIPEILPGGHVKIKKGDSSLIDGTYNVVEVRHTYGSDGYRTTFDVEGWKL